MSITDGFDTADSFSELPSSVLTSTSTHGGVTVKVYIQECQGYAQDGIHGWYHVGVDLVDTDTGKIIDSIPYQNGSDITHLGHYTHENAVLSAHEITAKFDMSYASAASHGEVDNDTWKDTFYAARNYRKAAQQFENAMIKRLLASLADDDEDEFSFGYVDEEDSDDFMMRLLDMVDSDDEVDVLGDFDPFAAGPTDEGLTDGL